MDPRLVRPLLIDWDRFDRQVRRNHRQEIGRWVLVVALLAGILFSGVTVFWTEARASRCFVYLDGEPEYWDYNRPGCGD